MKYKNDREIEGETVTGRRARVSCSVPSLLLSWSVGGLQGSPLPVAPLSKALSRGDTPLQPVRDSSVFFRLSRCLSVLTLWLSGEVELSAGSWLRTLVEMEVLCDRAGGALGRAHVLSTHCGRRWNDLCDGDNASYVETRDWHCPNASCGDLAGVSEGCGDSFVVVRVSKQIIQFVHDIGYWHWCSGVWFRRRRKELIYECRMGWPAIDSSLGRMNIAGFFDGLHFRWLLKVGGNLDSIF